MWLGLVLLVAAAPQAQDAYERELAALQQQEAQQVQAKHTTCAVGWHWNAYSKACEVCPAGKFQALPGALECEACPQGRYNLLQGQMECKPNPCPAGTEPTHTGCAECEPGSAAAKGDAECHKCDIMEGQYSYAGGMSECTSSTCLAEIQKLYKFRIQRHASRVPRSIAEREDPQAVTVTAASQSAASQRGLRGPVCRHRGSQHAARSADCGEELRGASAKRWRSVAERSCVYWKPKGAAAKRASPCQPTATEPVDVLGPMLIGGL